MGGHVRSASREALLAILQAMGASIASVEDVPSAIREKRQEHWRQTLEPVIVIWDNETLTVNLHLPSALVESSIKASLVMENGEQKDLVWRGDWSCVIESAEIESVSCATLRFYYPEKLPLGYHKLRLELPGQESEALIISAPLKAYAPQKEKEKLWGVFLPLYALHSHHSWGAGDFSDLEALMQWVAHSGGSLIGALPLLPSFFDKQFGPGPYMPASRLFWNEFYLNIPKVPEFERCPAAQAMLASADFDIGLSALRASHSVDYARQVRLQRNVLEELAQCFYREKTDRFFEFQRFSEANCQLEDYASFRAAGEQQGIRWNEWPESMRSGTIREGDYREENKRYHLYTQWLAQQQIHDLAENSRQNNILLYLDLPVGVHPFSYDVWRERQVFVPGVNGGAPPDPVFTSGQNWNFPPLHPEKIRRQGYNYVINSLRHQLKCASMLRIDHMMNFHRLFWIPEGMENRQGVYVGYRADELYAILTLESYRSQASIVGEDLGMVPPEVRPMMEKHGIYRMYVGQYELIAENQLGKINSRSVASLNTHDMFPFAAFWQEKDIAERQKLKLIDEKSAQKELEERRNIKRILLSILQYRGLDNEISQDTGATLKAVLNLLAGSPAYALLVNLEDLWLETHPQNVPGTQRTQNWSRKARYSFEGFSQSPQVLDILQQINRVRKG